MAEQHYKEYEAYLQKFADSNFTSGVLYEPRVFFDYITLDGLNEVKGHPEVFRNGEEFPIILTEMTAAISYLEQDYTAVADERAIQRVGAYLNFHDQYYMNPPQQLGGGTTITSTPLPAWINKVVAASDTVSRGNSTWQFKKPFILSVRDTLEVQCALYSLPAAALPVTVSFTGIGMKSRQPYFFSGTQEFEDLSILTIDPESFANDGVEPVAITSMSVQVRAEITANDPSGDARRVFVRVRQRGNGTGKWWFTGPLNVQLTGGTQQVPTSSCCAVNLGQSMGRAVVHEFPVPLVWEPGEGILVTAQGLTAAAGDANNVMIALLGYVAVQ